MQQIKRDFDWAQEQIDALKPIEQNNNRRFWPIQLTQKERSNAPEGSTREQRRAYARKEAKLAKKAAKSKVPA
jgi:hypothetical protein